MISKKVIFIILASVVALSVGVIVFMLWTQMSSVLSKESFVFGGIERTYLLHVPPSYNGRTSVPLVIVLHGSGQSSTTAATFIKIEKSDKEGFIAVYPQGTSLSGGPDWNIGQFPDYYPNGPDDVGFINEIINRLEQKYKIDPKRIYITGFSAGAHMTNFLGAELSDRIAAIAPVAGSVGSSKDNKLYYIPEPSQPLSVITICGTGDSTYNGFVVGYGGAKTLSVAESVAFWVRCDGCSTNALNETSSDGNVIKSVYTGGTNGTEVVLYTLVGVGHTWPVSPTNYITATDIIWDFFKSHPKQ